MNRRKGATQRPDSITLKIENGEAALVRSQ
jgi:hypothetical protein